jgi:hypothetical protein
MPANNTEKNKLCSMNGAARHPGSTISVLVITLSVLCVLYFAVLAPERFGGYHDDSIYATTAKALATGQGYRVISLPYEPAQTKYPPFYPFLLSLIWRAYPQFPENIVWMMMLSAISTLSFLVLTYRYLTKLGYASRWQALVVVGLAGINWRTIILATGLYSEMPYAALSVLALHLADRDANKNVDWLGRFVLGTVAGLAFLTRSSGLALLMALGIFYALRRQWSKGATVVGIGGLFVLGWIAWCFANKTTAGGENAAYYLSYLGHLNQVVRDLQAQGDSSKLLVYLNIIFTNFVGGILVSVPLVCSGLNYAWLPSFGGSLLVSICALLAVFLALASGFIRAWRREVRLLHIYVVSCFGLYLFWLPGVAYDRFIMPLLPFLLYFVVSEFIRIGSIARAELRSDNALLRQLSGALIILILLAAISVNLGNYVSGIYQSFASVEKSAARAAEDAQAIDWINAHTDPPETLMSYRDPKFFLYTGHKTVRHFPMTEGYSWEEDDASMDKLAQSIFRIVDEADGRYVVVTSSDFELEDRPEQHRKIFNKLIELHPENFVLVFESDDRRTRIYQIVKTAALSKHR